MKKLSLFLVFTLLLTLLFGCAHSSEPAAEPEAVPEPEPVADPEPVPEPEPIPEPEPEPEPDEAELLLASMTLEQKVAQMFMVSPENLSGSVDSTVVSDATREGIAACPVGGIIYFGANLIDPEQTEELLSDTCAAYDEIGALRPLLAVDEEGGVVARIGGNQNFPVERIGPMIEVEGTDGAYQVGCTIGQYLRALGFNMDFAPVADVWSNPANKVIGNRSFGYEPVEVGEKACACAKGLREQGIVPVIKHYPGHGATEADSHEGYAFTEKTLDELLDCELIPFQMAADAQVEMIMAGHISTPNVTDDGLPASLSHELLTVFLRGQLGYEGIIITDAMGMGAISQNYSSAEATVKAIQAGVDIILLPEDFRAAYDGVLDAVASGELTEERIDESVLRIVRLKLAYEI